MYHNTKQQNTKQHKKTKPHKTKQRNNKSFIYDFQTTECSCPLRQDEILRISRSKRRRMLLLRFCILPSLSHHCLCQCQCHCLLCQWLYLCQCLLCHCQWLCGQVGFNLQPPLSALCCCHWIDGKSIWSKVSGFWYPTNQFDRHQLRLDSDLETEKMGKN